MGLIGDAFGKLFGFLGELIVGVLLFLGNVFGTLFSVIWEAIKWIGNLIWEAIKWIGDLIASLFQFLIDLLVMFFTAIFQLIEGILYLLYMIGVLAVKLFLVIFEAAKTLWSLIQGFGQSLASLRYTPRSSSGNGYSETIGKLFNSLEVMNLSSIAYILLFCLWFVTAITAIKLISSIRVGGD